MSDGGPRVGDLLGVQPAAKAIEVVTTDIMGLARGFLERLTYPAAEEFGELARDVVRTWRERNFARTIAKAQTLAPPNTKVHPRIVHQAFDYGSWVEDDAVQDWWAGLLASSCTKDGDDDSNLLFTNLLGQLSVVEARIINYACRESQKQWANDGLLYTGEVNLGVSQLVEIAEEPDISRLDREIDHMIAVGLFHRDSEIHSQRLKCTLKPTTLALHLYVRCQGSRMAPDKYFREIEP